ncbi:hypothetical protein EMB92_09275 [Bifidobacterium callitrichos]|uniref:DUF5050 domain-containing protein n=1 Tax=Bifidobacterium callitrichos TaxID=762209 RepID=A0A5M9ZC06_9BIFI|nr:hypothetical protein [Bifidobacterium callitrichos]KAA8815374.1 hypothetical protein EMB92_09275 [Bifidobacterium callitrichos]
MRRKASLLVAVSCVVAAVLLSVSCGVSVNTDNKDGKSVSNQSDNLYWLPNITRKSEVYIYDRLSHRLATFDVDKEQIVNRNDKPNFMQYEFNDIRSNIYTSGDSISNHFTILKVADNKIRTLWKGDENIAVFPLAFSEGTLYFVQSVYGENGDEKYEDRAIYSFDESAGDMECLSETKGMKIDSGVLINNDLYFTVYDDSSNKYNLLRLTLSSGFDPVLIKDGLESGSVYKNNGVIWIEERDSICSLENEKTCIHKSEFNYFYGENVIQLDSLYEDKMRLTIRNSSDNSVRFSVDDCIGFRYADSTMDIYKHDGGFKYRLE